VNGTERSVNAPLSIVQIYKSKNRSPRAATQRALLPLRQPQLIPAQPGACERLHSVRCCPRGRRPCRRRRCEWLSSGRRPSCCHCPWLPSRCRSLCSRPSCCRRPCCRRAVPVHHCSEEELARLVRAAHQGARGHVAEAHHVLPIPAGGVRASSALCR